jgi:AraC family transcriptional regulator, alkane utilization regulator
MINSTVSFAETSAASRNNCVIGSIMASLQVNGSVLLRETYTAPWSISIPDAAQLASVLGAPPASRVVAFHLVEDGHCLIDDGLGPVAMLRSGQMAMSFGGQPHRMYAGRAQTQWRLEDLLTGAAQPHAQGSGRNQPPSSLLCGVFVLQLAAFNPLLPSLPKMLLTPEGHGEHARRVRTLAAMISDEIVRASACSAYIIARLLETLCAEVVRTHYEVGAVQAPSWLYAMRDPQIASVIAAVHADPAADWSVARMAQMLSLSPSRFATRFVDALGKSPISYVAEWRMNVARRLLMQSAHGLTRIADEVGYDSVAAFNRAFRKHTGLPPAAWRQRERDLSRTP